MDWAQQMVYSEEFSTKETPTIEEYDIIHDEWTDKKNKKLNDILLICMLHKRKPNYRGVN